MMNIITQTTKYVIEKSMQVKINQSAINQFCKNIEHKHIKHWLTEAPFDVNKLSSEQRLTFLLFFNSISFSYWGEPKWAVSYKGRRFDGSWAMIASLAKALESKKSIFNSDYLSTISEQEFTEILKGEEGTKIPLFDERLKIVREVASAIKTKCNNSILDLVQAADNDTLKLLNIIITTFPSFEDSTVYKGRKVFFYKRAQLLVADIYQAFKESGSGNLKNIDKLTACADYKIPQMLRKLGILEYSTSLANKIGSFTQILKHSEEEVEIRASTIWAVELIKQTLRDKMPRVNSIHVNDHLWLLSQTKSEDDRPYHRTRTTAY